MPTESFPTRLAALAFAASIPGAYVARDPAGKGWIVIWPG